MPFDARCTRLIVEVDRQQGYFCHFFIDLEHDAVPAIAAAGAAPSAAASSSGIAAAAAAAVPASARGAPSWAECSVDLKLGGQRSGAHCPSCAVDGCKADLSKCRGYRRRHKVCETHSKTPSSASPAARCASVCSKYTQQFQPFSVHFSLLAKIHKHSFYKADCR
ncbi:hypothetical protein GQ55_4G093500 [Panicum hallii var. hallii]|uniref:SBP-type domain-containing protein n=1 Tax=Panicum hallii var. hallii TaxID=1504633 RepID=A0A2T7DWV2_9POAL|nr:hypothetical protein GQ55_4G093500 [Panicum hallii var. hallii]